MDNFEKNLPTLICLVLLIVGSFCPFRAYANISDSSVYHLTYTPTRVTKGFTENVRLRCEKDASTSSTLDDVERIRILKQSNSGRWWTVAQIRDFSDEVESDDQVNATGWMDYFKAEAFLEVEWAVAKDDTFGVFKCDVVGFDKHLYHDVESTAKVEIVDQTATKVDMHNFLTKMLDDMTAKVSENANKLKEVEENQKQMLVSDFGKDFVAKEKLVVWPAGQYGLLQPRSGCPVDLAFFGGDTGFVSFKIEPTKDIAQLNLAAPILEKRGEVNNLFFHFCVVTRIFNTNPAPWPQGTYCIHQAGKDCPDTFESTTKLDGDHGIDRNKFVYGGVLPHIKPTHFCCKNSGSPDVPIVLPTENPFYLYRYGASCQQVENMDVTEEDLRFQPTETHVPVSLDLCYYAKRIGSGQKLD